MHIPFLKYSISARQSQYYNRTIHIILKAECFISTCILSQDGSAGTKLLDNFGLCHHTSNNEYLKMKAHKNQTADLPTTEV